MIAIVNGSEVRAEAAAEARARARTPALTPAPVAASTSASRGARVPRRLARTVVLAALMVAGALSGVAFAASGDTAVDAAGSVSTSVAAAQGNYTHQTAPTRYVEVNGARIAYRRFGKTGGVPLVFFQHFVGNMDNWDPKVIDGLAENREVVLFDNAGVAASSGDVPTTVEGMAAYGAALIDALHIKQADLLGFSLGSLVAQQVGLQRPDLVRRLVLVGSGPRGGVGMATLTPEFQAMLKKKRASSDDLLLDVFFTQSASSQAAGRAFIQRLNARQVDRDVNVNAKVAPAQVAAFSAWGVPHAHADAYLKKIRQPVLVVVGDHDIVHYPINSFTLEKDLPNAQLAVYPDANHGAAYQYPDRFITDVTTFLDQD